MTREHQHTTIEALLAHAGWLDELAQRLVADPHDAEEIVQETWIAALNHPPRTSVPLRAWLARVARNFALQRGRSERARRAREQSVSRSEGTAAESQALERAWAHQRLVEAVLELHEPYRATVVMHFFDRMPVAEVAARQGVPESTVRTRLSRAIGMLRVRFQRDDGEAWLSVLAPLVPALRESKISALSTTAAASSAPLLAGVGGVAMATMWKVGAGVAAALALGWFFWPSKPAPAPSLVAQAPIKPSTDGLAADARDATGQRVALKEPGDSSTSGPSPSSSASNDRASLDVHVRWGDDGTAAAGIVVGLWQASAPDPFVERREGRTDEHGNVHFEGLFPGNVHVDPDRCDAGSVKLEAGAAASFDATIADGVDIDGLVVDEKDAPVAGARIWISEYFNFHDGHEVDHSDANGRFHLRDVGPARYVAALRDGSGPSEEHLLEPLKAGSHIEMKLALTPAMGEIAGVVHDARGRPIANADVEMVTSQRIVTDESGSNRVAEFPPVHVRSDDSGAFAKRDVGASGATITVHARGFAAWQNTLAAQTGKREQLDVRLQAEAVVHGRILDPAGQPVVEAFVGCGEYAASASSQTWSRADGSYRLERLPAGIVEIRVSAQARGDDHRSFTLKEGDDVEWNITLQPRPGVRGRVVDAENHPLVGWLVGAVRPEHFGLHLRSTKTDAQGNFVLDNWPDEAEAVEVREPSVWRGDPAAIVLDVKPGGEDLAIQIARGALRSAFFTGRVLDTDGRAAVATQVNWYSAKTGQGYSEPTDADGRFRIGPLKPGSYNMSVHLEGRAPKELRELKLDMEQTLELGDIRVERSGTLIVRLHTPTDADRANSDHSLTLQNTDSKTYLSLELKDGEGRLKELAPGEYVLLFWSEKLRIPHTRLTIDSDRTTEIDVKAEPATSRSVRFVLPDHAAKPTSLHLRVTDASGAEICDSNYTMFPERLLVAGLGVGRHEVEASTDTGLSVRATLTVDTLEPSLVELELRLR